MITRSSPDILPLKYTKLAFSSLWKLSVGLFVLSRGVQGTSFGGKQLETVTEGTCSGGKSWSDARDVTRYGGKQLNVMLENADLNIVVKTQLWQMQHTVKPRQSSLSNKSNPVKSPWHRMSTFTSSFESSSFKVKAALSKSCLFLIFQGGCCS